MIELTPEQRREVREANGDVVRALDPDTRQEYVLVRAEFYERLRSLLLNGDDFAEAIYPQVMEVFGRDGWNDPSMDIYDRLDPRKQA